jgi:hypothetical protein
MQLEDWNWTFEERTEIQFKHFVMLGAKGMVLAYPTIRPNDSDDFYSKEQVQDHVRLASNAPRMYRCLQSVAKRLEILGIDDVGARALLQEVREELQVVEGQP